MSALKSQGPLEQVEVIFQVAFGAVPAAASVQVPLTLASAGESDPPQALNMNAAQRASTQVALMSVEFMTRAIDVEVRALNHYIIW
jgi:hypothetical protein